MRMTRSRTTLRRSNNRVPATAAILNTTIGRGSLRSHDRATLSPSRRGNASIQVSGLDAKLVETNSLISPSAIRIECALLQNRGAAFRCVQYPSHEGCRQCKLLIGDAAVSISDMRRFFIRTWLANRVQSRVQR